MFDRLWIKKLFLCFLGILGLAASYAEASLEEILGSGDPSSAAFMTTRSQPAGPAGVQAARRYSGDSTDQERDCLTILKSDLVWCHDKLCVTEVTELMHASAESFQGDLEAINTFQQNLESIKVSFLLHELGNRVLRSSLVNEIYYSLKPSLGTGSNPTYHTHLADFEIASTNHSLAHIRLINRCDKRHNYTCVPQRVRGKPAKYEVQGEDWVTKCFGIDMRHALTFYKTGSKSVVLLNAGTYSAELGKLEKIMQETDLGNADIARAMKQLIQNPEAELEEILDTCRETIKALTYLLFVVEPHRNPASLVVHAMALDLIENEKLGWRQTLTESACTLPMTPAGATKPGLFLNHYLQTSLRYTYDKRTNHGFDDPRHPKPFNLQSVTNQLCQERNIVTAWLRWKKESGDLALADAISDGSLLSSLIYLCEEWYQSQENRLRNTFVSPEYLMDLKDRILGTVPDLADHESQIGEELDRKNIKLLIALENSLKLGGEEAIVEIKRALGLEEEATIQPPLEPSSEEAVNPTSTSAQAAALTATEQPREGSQEPNDQASLKESISATPSQAAAVAATEQLRGGEAFLTANDNVEEQINPSSSSLNEEESAEQRKTSAKAA